VNYRVKKSIRARRGPREDINNIVLRISPSEQRMMRKVMHETDGLGGPWFYRYAIKKGLL